MIERMKSWGKAQWIAMAIGVVFFVALIDVLNDPKEPAASEQPTASACDNHLKFTLQGRKFKSHTVLGKRVVQLNPEDPAELWVSYDGEVDGANVVVLCAVGGTSDKPEVVKADVTLP